MSCEGWVKYVYLVSLSASLLKQICAQLLASEKFDCKLLLCELSVLQSPDQFLVDLSCDRTSVLTDIVVLVESLADDYDFPVSTYL